MPHSGHTECLCRCTLLLGVRIGNTGSTWSFCIPGSCRRHNDTHSGSTVYHSSSTLSRSAKILPPNPRQDSGILQKHISPEDHNLVFSISGATKLFPQYALLAQLGLPLGLQVRAWLGGVITYFDIFHRRLVCASRAAGLEIEDSFLDFANFRDRSWGSQMGADALGHLRYWALGAMDCGWSTRQCPGRSDTMAMAGRFGFNSRCGIWHDAVTDIDPNSYCGITVWSPVDWHGDDFNR